MRQLLEDQDYRYAMGRLLVLYTQIDYLIMRACAERIADAPDDMARMSLAKQVGDECRHVQIQEQWIEKFGVDHSPVLSDQHQVFLLEHFRGLGWKDFLADMYVCVEALGSEAVHQIVPLADPGTRESLKEPLQDETDHVEFGLGRLKQELDAMPVSERQDYINSISKRLDFLEESVHQMGLDIPGMFEAVGADYQSVVDNVMMYRREILNDLSMSRAA